MTSTVSTENLTRVKTPSWAAAFMAEILTDECYFFSEMPDLYWWENNARHADCSGWFERGDYEPHQINVIARVWQAQEKATLVHEISHFLTRYSTAEHGKTFWKTYARLSEKYLGTVIACRRDDDEFDFRAAIAGSVAA